MTLAALSIIGPMLILFGAVMAVIFLIAGA
jgi:hypothetical protein